MKSKTLFIVASDYPFGPGEPFLETELKYIASKFNKIYFVVTTPGVNLKNKILFYLPENSEIIFTNKKIYFLRKILSIRFIFLKLFYSELNILKRFYKVPVNLLIIKIMFSALSKADLFLKNIRLILKEKQIDPGNCIFYSYWNNEFSLALAILKKQNSRVKVFTRTHGWDIYFERHIPPYLPFKTFKILNLDAIFTISENGKEYITEKNKHIEFSNVKVSRLGTQPGFFNHFYKKDKVIKILSIAYLAKLKRIDLIIDSIAAIDSFSVEWTHIGGGKPFYNLKNYAINKFENKSNIKWDLKGNLSKAEIYSILQDRCFDFLINTSYTEGIPVSMMEAMSFGIPVVGTNVGGVSEIIEDNKNGYLLPPNASPAQISIVIEKIAKLNDTEFASLREHAFNTWKTKYNSELNYNKFTKELDLLI